jgi:glycolate oxidase iron-sulfur subunit
MDSSQYLDHLSKCVRCGSCKAFCPTYDESTTETMSARGRLALLYALAQGNLSPSPALCDRIFSCTLCGACYNSCPSGVDIKEAILHGRTILRGHDKKRRFIRSLINFSIRRPDLSFRFLGVTHHILMPFLLKKDFFPFRLELPDRSLRETHKVIPVPQKKGRIALFSGCMVNFVYPHLGESLINVLHSLGYEVILPPTEVCCGAPLRGLGLEEEARELARKNVRLFNSLNIGAVLSLCPTCTLTIQREYPSLIGEGIHRAQDISVFLLNNGVLSGIPDVSRIPRRALYHSPCHLKYGLSIDREPREILREIGIELVKTSEERCCGFAGTFCFAFPKLSGQILESCVKEYSKSDAEMIITACPGCIMQLSRSFREKPVVHIIEILEEAIVKNSLFGQPSGVLHEMNRV